MYVQSVKSKDQDVQHKQASKTLSFSFLFFFLFFLHLCPVDIPEIDYRGVNSFCQNGFRKIDL